MNKSIGFIEYSEIAEFRNGLNFSKESHGVGCPLIGVADFKSHFAPQYDSLEEINPSGIAKDQDYLRKGDLIFVRSNGNKALVGRSLYIDRDVRTLYSGFCIRARLISDKVDPLFLAYFTKTDFFKSSISHVAGTNINNLNQGILGDVKIPLYPKNIQTAIASVLSVIDEKIENNNHINTGLEAMAKTLYGYWFVQFDFPGTNGKPYKTSGGKMVYSEVLKQDVPEGWKVNTLSDWIRADKTGDWGKESQQGNYTIQVDCIRGADINGLNGNGKVNTPNRFILKKNEHKLISAFDFVIEISGGSPAQSTGRMAFMTENCLERFKYPVICSNFCKAISLVDNQYFYNFAYMWNRLYYNDILFGWEGKTSGIKNLLFDSFVSKYQVCMPPEKEAKKFFDFVRPLQDKKQKLLQENSELETLRDWLLPMLMNGQVAVK
jgi:type I restriction enzyme S subunit